VRVGPLEVHRAQGSDSRDGTTNGPDEPHAGSSGDGDKGVGAGARGGGGGGGGTPAKALKEWRSRRPWYEGLRGTTESVGPVGSLGRRFLQRTVWIRDDPASPCFALQLDAAALPDSLDRWASLAAALRCLSSHHPPPSYPACLCSISVGSVIVASWTQLHRAVWSADGGAVSAEASASTACVLRCTTRSSVWVEHRTAWEAGTPATSLLANAQCWRVWQWRDALVTASDAAATVAEAPLALSVLGACAPALYDRGRDTLFR